MNLSHPVKTKLLPLWKKMRPYIENLSTITTKKIDVFLDSTINSERLPYHSLSPIADADPDNVYCNALKWALDNRHDQDIKNIALTGPYGSGKSSILKTFQQRNKNKSLKFLNISLATFKEENTLLSQSEESKGALKDREKVVIPDVKKDETLRLIELSILQQIFYSEKASEISDSRFAERKKLSEVRRLGIVGAVFIILVSLYSITHFDFLLDQLGYSNMEYIMLITDFSFVYVLIGGLFCLYLLIPWLRNVQINKLDFGQTKIELGSHLSKSVLNENLEEILYFFKSTNYNVVAIEDLDRFRQIEIFTKLRELNLLINGSRKSNSEVVFIYAVRDDMFEDKDRAKFFDFIIPVIPPINSSNSNEKLREKLLNPFNISPALIDDVSLFVDDMRLVHNIINEYYVYRNKLSIGLKQDNLLAIVVYKNLQPNDFVNLSRGKGNLYNKLSSREKYINTKVTEVDLKISALQAELKRLDEISLKDVRELRMIYILQYLNKLENFTSFRINGRAVNMVDVVDDDNWNVLRRNGAEFHSLQLQHSNYYIPRNAKISIKFDEIEKIVNSSLSYEVREKQIIDWHEQRSETIKQQIRDCREDIVKLREMRLTEILAKIPAEVSEKPEDKLISLMLRSGYIDENYLDYISIFHEGSLTKIDNNFLINVKTRTRSSFDVKLVKMADLVKKIPVTDFDAEYIFNFKLLDFLIDNSTTYKDRHNRFITQLANGGIESITFVDQYLEKGERVTLFMAQLVEKWPGIWFYVNGKSQYPEEKKLNYLKLILTSAKIDCIKNIADVSDLKDVISVKADFLTFLNDSNKTINIIESLDIKFKSLDIERQRSDLFEKIYTGNHYMINEHMLRYILHGIDKLDEDTFSSQNYTCIKDSNSDLLIKYVNENINEYLTEVYLKLENNNEEREENYLELLRDAAITHENKLALIDKIETQIETIDIALNGFNELLFERGKVKAIWQTVSAHFVNNENKFTDGLTSFLNTNATDELVLLPIADIISGEDRNVFSAQLVFNNNLGMGNYGKLINAVVLPFSELDFSNVNEDKVKFLLDAGIIGFSVANFNLIRTHFGNLYLEFIKKNTESFLNNLSEYYLTDSEIIDLCESSFLNDNQKQTILLSKDESGLISSPGLTSVLVALVLKSQLQFSKNIISGILNNEAVSQLNRALILNERELLFERDEIPSIIKIINPDFAPLFDEYMEIEVESNDANNFLKDVVKSKGLSSGSKLKKGFLVIKPLSPPSEIVDPST
jgi:hypothetical protein